MEKNITTIAALFILTSCDCLQVVRGTVVDLNTDKPLKNVHVFKDGKSYDECNTDSSGAFQIESISGGMFGCPGMTVVIEKDGYEKQIVKIGCGDFKKIALKTIAVK